MKRKRVVIISDLHCGHRVGLTPPRHQPKADEDAPRHVRKIASERKFLWDWFEKEIKSLGPISRLVVNGDAIEGKGTKSGGVELLTADREEQADIAADAINSIGAAQVFATFGTPYHVGADEDWESVVFNKVERFEKLEAEGHYDVNGLQVVCKHFIGNTSSTASRGTALSNAQIKQLLWAASGHQARANLLIRSHVHRCFGILDPAMNFQAYTTPALQGMGSKFGARQCDSLPVHFGFLVADVESPKHWSVAAHICPNTYAPSQVTKL